MAALPPRHAALKDSTPCLIRSASAHDAIAIIELLSELSREPVFTVYEPDEFEAGLAPMLAKIVRYEAASGGVMLVAEVNGVLVGELTFRAGKYRRLAHRGELGMTVASAWRGRGVGRLLLTTLIEWAAFHPVIEKINLCVFANNERAIALYRSLGFREEGRRVREIRIGEGLYVDDLVMARSVKPGQSQSES